MTAITVLFFWAQLLIAGIVIVRQHRTIRRLRAALEMEDDSALVEALERGSVRVIITDRHFRLIGGAVMVDDDSLRACWERWRRTQPSSLPKH